MDPTLAPTTSRAAHPLRPGRASARATLRVVSTTLTAAAIGLAASIIFSSPESTSSAALARPGADPVEAPAVAPAAQLPPADLPAAPSSPATRSEPAAAPAGPLPAAVPAPATAQTPKNDSAVAPTSKTRKPSVSTRRKARKTVDTTSLKRSR